MNSGIYKITNIVTGDIYDVPYIKDLKIFELFNPGNIEAT